jgi:CDP-diacylglycerol--glycerol-3-phosphate 3-phosphatidyltransferase
VIFGIAAITDLLDGWIARRFGHVTAIGALLDPIADKMLIAAALILLASADALPVFLAGVLICRDIGVNGLRLLALEQKITIEVRDSGKLKTVFQSVGIFCLFVYKPLFEIRFREIGMICIWVALAFSLYSAWSYASSYWEKVKEQESTQS